MTKTYPWKWYLADLPKTPIRGKVFSTFACGGGSSMGYKCAGFEMVGCCEIDPKINDIYTRNLHPKHNFVMDLRDFNKLEDLPEELYALDILDGSPPCSTFSMAGSREDAWGKEKKFTEGQKKQTLDDLFFVYLDTVAKLRPKISVAENVKGLVCGNAKGYCNEIIKRYRGLGYEVQVFLLNGADMGTPQRRERVFFVANRMGYPKLRLDFRAKHIPFGAVKSGDGMEIGGDKSKVGSTLRVLSKAIRSDKTLADVSKRERGKNVRFTTSLLWDNDFANTLTATSPMVRMPEMKYVGIEDIRNISSFPQDYDFSVGIGTDDIKAIWRKANFVCGMSVPPCMSAGLANAIGEQWLDKEKGAGR